MNIEKTACVALGIGIGLLAASVVAMLLSPEMASCLMRLRG